MCSRLLDKNICQNASSKMLEFFGYIMEDLVRLWKFYYFTVSLIALAIQNIPIALFCTKNSLHLMPPFKWSQFLLCVLKQHCITLSRLSSLIYGSISKECLQRPRLQREASGKSTKSSSFNPKQGQL